MYSECGIVNEVLNGSKHTTQNWEQACYVNTKLAAGMITAILYVLGISTITCIHYVFGIYIIPYVLKN